MGFMRCMPSPSLVEPILMPTTTWSSCCPSARMWMCNWPVFSSFFIQSLDWIHYFRVTKLQGLSWGWFATCAAIILNMHHVDSLSSGSRGSSSNMTAEWPCVFNLLHYHSQIVASFWGKAGRGYVWCFFVKTQISSWSSRSMLPQKLISRQASPTGPLYWECLRAGIYTSLWGLEGSGLADLGSFLCPEKKMDRKV